MNTTELMSVDMSVPQGLQFFEMDEAVVLGIFEERELLTSTLIGGLVEYTSDKTYKVAGVLDATPPSPFWLTTEWSEERDAEALDWVALQRLA